MITNTVKAAPVPSRPRRTASTGFDLGVRVTGSRAGGMRVVQHHVARVWPGEGAARAGLQAGDVILAVNGADVKEPGNFAALMAQKPGTPYVLRISRGGVERDVVARLDPIPIGYRVPS